MNSEPFRFGWKMVGFDWFLAKNQSGCCRFDPCFVKARLCFYKGLNLKNRSLALLFCKV